MMSTKGFQPAVHWNQEGPKSIKGSLKIQSFKKGVDTSNASGFSEDPQSKEEI